MLAEAEFAGESIRALSPQVCEILSGSDADVRTRPAPNVWSQLEYGCHLRDVLLVQRERVLGARRASGAPCTPMGRDERVEHDGYSEQDPLDVARQVGDAALMFTNVLARLADEDWDRTVVYNYPEPAERTLRWVALHTAHEVQHHLRDMRGVG